MYEKLYNELHDLNRRRRQTENEMNRVMRRYHDDLRKMDKQIQMTEELIRKEKAHLKGSDRTDDWNRERSGMDDGEKSTKEKLYEREYIYDSDHRSH